jgi:glycosyltransferase involved in cell wall biosynthesis
MTDNPLASVIILTYNSQKHIRQTLNGIIRQKTNFPFEIIISDDGSSDNTIAILHEYEQSNHNIRIFRNLINNGIIINYKKAVDQCSGKYFAFCGHDDYWHDDSKLQDQVDLLENNPGFGMVHTDYDFLDEITGNVIRSTNNLNKFIIRQGDVSQDLIETYYIGSCTPCYRKSVFYKYVPIDDFIRLDLPFEDIPVNISIALHSEIGYIDRSTATFRYGHKSASNPADFTRCERYLEGHEKMIDYFYDKYPEKFIFKKKNYPIFKYTRMLKYAYEQKDFKKAEFYASQLKILEQRSLQIHCARNSLLFTLYFMSRNNRFLYGLYLVWYRFNLHLRRS